LPLLYSFSSENHDHLLLIAQLILELDHGKSPSPPSVVPPPHPDPYLKASGVAVNDKCLSEYQALKLGHKYKYIVYKINDLNTEIVVDKTSTASDYEEFLNDLPETECRWAIYDFEYQKEGGKRNKIAFVSW